ncbi:hypothetical protein LOK49_LG14G00970 [Camellia lanceoleosa]|uniref:Uncharacterized protein n=1 Tax=Camellia lanceoleosa TaxID=1840588 RepID=A0ACC0FDY6_9ERIC|nr:hypothetical protein LOK49_LG14G00970 [Camellia lanceoleosa]
MEIDSFKGVFQRFGKVTQASIPNRRTKKFNSRFGFICYDNQFSAEEAHQKFNGAWYGDHRLIVKPARFERPLYRAHAQSIQKQTTSTRERNQPISRHPPQLTNQFKPSFAEALKRGHQAKVSNIRVHAEEGENEWLYRSVVQDYNPLSRYKQHSHKGNLAISKQPSLHGKLDCQDKLSTEPQRSKEVEEYINSNFSEVGLSKDPSLKQVAHRSSSPLNGPSPSNFFIQSTHPPSPFKISSRAHSSSTTHSQSGAHSVNTRQPILNPAHVVELDQTIDQIVIPDTFLPFVVSSPPLVTHQKDLPSPSLPDLVRDPSPSFVPNSLSNQINDLISVPLVNSGNTLKVFEEPSKPFVGLSKRKSKRKLLQQVLGNFTAGENSRRGGRKKGGKPATIRSAAASYSLSLSSDAIANRNRILLNEAEAVWQIGKLLDLHSDEHDAEVVSKIKEIQGPNVIVAMDQGS